MIQVLFFAANPVGTQFVDWDREVRAITVIYDGEGVQYDICPAAEPDDIPRKLQLRDPQVVHFSGHGTGVGLTFHAPDGTAEEVPIDAIKKWLRAVGKRVEIVVLNACYTEAQAKSLAEEIPCVIGMEGKILDANAKRFGPQFYRSLLMNPRAPVKTAFDVATVDARTFVPSAQPVAAGENNPTAAERVTKAWLHHRPDVDPSDVFFPTPPKAESECGSDDKDARLEPVSKTLAAFRFFPHGTLESVTRALSPKLGTPAGELDSLLKKGVLARTTTDDGLAWIAPSPDEIEGRRTVVDPTVPAEQLYPILLSHLTGEGAFVGWPALGATQFILLRDLIGLASGAEVSPAELYQALGFSIDAPMIAASAGYRRVGATLFNSLQQFDAGLKPAVIIEGAKALLANQQAGTAFHVLNLYEGGNLFPEWGAFFPDRFDAVLVWAASAKAAGLGRSRHREICRAYENALEILANDPGSMEAADLEEARADLLNNYGTQLAVFGEAGDFERAILLLKKAEAIWIEAAEPGRAFLCCANIVAHFLDRGQSVPVELAARMAKAHRAIADGAVIEPSDDLFFFFFQYARLLRRNGSLDSAIMQFQTAGQVARIAESAREILARRQFHKTRFARGDYLASQYVPILKGLADELAAKKADAWFANTRIAVLRDLARYQPEQAWGHLAEAFRISRGAEGRAFPLDAATRVAREMSRLTPTCAERAAFLAAEDLTLRKILRKQPWESMDWSDIENLCAPVRAGV